MEHASPGLDTVVELTGGGDGLVIEHLQCADLRALLLTSRSLASLISSEGWRRCVWRLFLPVLLCGGIAVRLRGTAAACWRTLHTELSAPRYMWRRYARKPGVAVPSQLRADRHTYTLTRSSSLVLRSGGRYFCSLWAGRSSDVRWVEDGGAMSRWALGELNFAKVLRDRTGSVAYQASRIVEPSARFGHSLSHLAGRDFLLFGGHDRFSGSTTFDDLWLLQLQPCSFREGRLVGNWRHVQPAGAGPGPRRDHAVTVIQGGRRAVLTGGSLSGGKLEACDVFVLECPDTMHVVGWLWTEVQVRRGPKSGVLHALPGRCGHEMRHKPQSSCGAVSTRFLVFGGQQFGVSRGFQDCWCLELCAPAATTEAERTHRAWWTNVAKAEEEERTGHGLVLLGNRLLAVGGEPQAGQSPHLNIAELDLSPALRRQNESLTTLKWRPVLSDGEAPSPRKGHLCRLKEGARILFAGGFAFERDGEVLPTDSDAWELCLLHDGAA